MALFNPSPVTLLARENERIWMTYDNNSERWLADIYVRRSGGIHFLSAAYLGDRPPLAVLIRDAYLRGTWAARPFYIGDIAHRGDTACVLALFTDYCRSLGLEPIQFIHDMRDPEPFYDNRVFADIEEQAQWEGVELPEEWNAERIRALIEHLYDLHYRSLARLIEGRLSPV
jgi:hypothetical protein